MTRSCIEVNTARCPVCNCVSLEEAQLTAEQLEVAQDVPRTLPYLECTQCGMWLQFPPPAFQYEADDEVDRRKEGVLVEAGHYKWLASRLTSTYHPTSVLDIGSSYPLLLHFLKTDHNVPSLMGIDGCGKTLEYADELDVPVVQGNFLEHDFGVRKFDLITMVHVIEHFNEPLAPLLKMTRLLNPGGRIFIRTPLHDTTGVARWHLTKFHFQVHPILFSQRSLKRACERVGLRLVNESVGNHIGHGDYDFQKR